MNQNRESFIEEFIKTKSRTHHFIGIVTILLVFFLLGSWAAFSKIDTTVIGEGVTVVKNYKKVVSHPRGGIVKYIFIKEGDFVEKGDPLIELDNVAIEAKLHAKESELCRLLALKGGLEAEIDLKENIIFPKELSSLQCLEKEKIINKQIEMTKAVIEDLKQKEHTSRNQIKIFRKKIEGLKKQIVIKSRLLESLQKELQKWKELKEKGFATETKLMELERKIDQLQSEIVQDKSQIVELKAQIDYEKSKIQSMYSEFKKKTYEKLNEVNDKISTLKEEIKALKNELKNSIIKAPASGIVTDLKITAAGEVISPNKPIMYIVPKNHELIIDTKILPHDRDKISLGKKAIISFPAFVDPSAVPIEGEIVYISADVINQTTPTGTKSYYKVIVKITPQGQEAIKKNGFKIVSGMPATVYIKAAKRTPLSYILMPLEKIMKGAFHEN